MSIFYMQILKFTYSYLHMSIDFRTFARKLEEYAIDQTHKNGTKRTI